MGRRNKTGKTKLTLILTKIPNGIDNVNGVVKIQMRSHRQTQFAFCDSLGNWETSLRKIQFSVGIREVWRNRVMNQGINTFLF